MAPGPWHSYNCLTLAYVPSVVTWPMAMRATHSGLMGCSRKHTLSYPDTELDTAPDMELKLWATSLNPALLKPQLYFFHGSREGNATLESEK